MEKDPPTHAPQLTYVKDHREYPRHTFEDGEYDWELPGRIRMTREYWEKVFVPRGYTIDIKRRALLKSCYGKMATVKKNYWVITLKPPKEDYVYEALAHYKCTTPDCPIHSAPPTPRSKQVMVNENRQYYEDYIPPF